ncbi:MAG: alpha-1,2-fucosyltransferase [Akkermansia sp.]|nr:alpha-1,2-fucosyltransferase [Akkermansia sp.]MBQ2814786.1 alpha-1,2-fucosyltransferase [Akkermansia sp.]
MKVIRITDGLGNQMFQYAFALALQKMTGEEVYLDRTWFPEYGGKLRNAVRRVYGLDVFQLSINEYVTAETSHDIIYGEGLMGKLNEFLHLRPGLLREGKHPLGLPELGGYVGKNKVFRGFFQQASYAEFAREDLLVEFRIDDAVLDAPNLDMLAQIRAAGECAVAVHVRRGDYVNAATQSVFGLCSADYYARAARIVADKVGKTPHLFVFSDDPEWVRNDFRSDFPLTAVDINSPDTGHLDINLMRHCHHAITANSTFSWWGAWLIPHDDAVVVSPEKWFASSGRAEGLQPSRWILA